MNFLPSNTQLGELEIVEVYDFYDKPCLFSCKNQNESLFASIWTDETEEYDEWLYVAISPERLERAQLGYIDLRKLFRAAESGTVFKIQTYFENNNSDIVTLKCTDLLEDQLPEPGEYLVQENAFVPDKIAISNEHSFIDESMQNGTSILDFRFSYPNGEVPVLETACMMTSTQKLVDALTELQTGNPTVKGKLKREVLEKSKLTLTGTYQGSFGMRMANFAQPDVFNHSDFEEALSTCIELIDISADLDTLRDLLSELKPRVTSKYKVFIEHIIRARANLCAGWISTDKRRWRKSSLSLREARKALSIVNEVIVQNPVEYTLRAELVGVNKRTKSFEIRDLDSDKKYSGRILDDALSVAESATISNIYSVVLREEIEVKLGGEEDIKYKLVSLR
ncbi:MAG: DUF6575 domain-containing protein [Cyanobacteria bacterium P01_C01_bin.89]